MQAASPAALKRRLRERARLLVQGIDAAPAAAQTETGFDAGRVAPCVQADRQSTVNPKNLWLNFCPRPLNNNFHRAHYS